MARIWVIISVYQSINCTVFQITYFINQNDSLASPVQTWLWAILHMLASTAPPRPFRGDKEISLLLVQQSEVFHSSSFFFFFTSSI